MSVLSIINNKTTVFDLLWNAMADENPKLFYYIYKLCVRAKTNNYVLHYNLYDRCFRNKYNPELFDTRTHKLFRKSLANFLRKGKI